MSPLFVFVAVAAAVVPLAAAHPHPLPDSFPSPSPSDVRRSFSVLSADGGWSWPNTTFPPVHSYHVHALFDGRDSEEVKKAERLLNLFEEKLGPRKNCSFFFANPNTCILGFHTEPDGPFLSGNLGVFVPATAEQYFPVSQFFQQQASALGIALLIHPNTGWEYWDHAAWSVWSGRKWPLDTSIFAPGPDPPNSTWPIHRH